MKTVPAPMTLQGPSGMERFFDVHAAARQQAQVCGERESVDVEQGQDVDQDVVGREPPGVWMPAALEARLACVWTTPLGRPVVPEL